MYVHVGLTIFIDEYLSPMINFTIIPPFQIYHLVITGHSLGSGVATILAILMRQNEEYGPDMQCFAFSPPGGLVRCSMNQRCVSKIQYILGSLIFSSA